MHKKSKTSDSKLKRFNAVCKIRAQLLWIWFLKNLVTFLKLAVIICLVLIAFGVITPDSILGLLFGDVINAWDEAKQTGFETMENVLAALISIGISILMILKKTRSISINDIKSRNLKIAMIKANLYFNENGKLCKKLEEATNMDLNGDGKAGDKYLKDIPNENVITGVGKATAELITILSADIDPDADKEKVVEGAELSEAIEPAVVVEEKLFTEDKEPEEEIKMEETSELIKEEKKRDNFIKRFFRNIAIALSKSKEPEITDNLDRKPDRKHKVKKIEKEEKVEATSHDIEIVTENVTDEIEQVKIENFEVAEEVKPVEDIKVEEVKEVKPISTKTVQSVKAQPQSSKAKQIDDILHSL